MRLNGQDPNDASKKSGAGRPVEPIRLADDRLSIVEQPHGTQTWYDVIFG